jgi:hypothetical protein
MRRLYPTLLLLSTFLTTFGQTSQVSHSDNKSVATSNYSTSKQPAESFRTMRSSSVPPELVGEWLARRGSGSSYFNPNT